LLPRDARLSDDTIFLCFGSFVIVSSPTLISASLVRVSTDLSSSALFEEVSYHEVRATEEALNCDHLLSHRSASRTKKDRAKIIRRSSRQ
jgi:hypothetical protein